MEYLIDQYVAKPEKVNKLLHSPVQVSLKVDGAAFQIGYDSMKDEITYHKRSGVSKRLGPIIMGYEQLFRKSINDAIDYFNTKKDIIKQNKVYAIELFNGLYILLTVIDKNDNVIQDPNKIKKIADGLGIDFAPILFNGVFNQQQIESIISLMNLDETTSNEDFKKHLTTLFGDGNWSKFMLGSEVEGIVLTWAQQGDPQQYKIINPAFKARHKKEIEVDKQQADQLNNIYKCLYNKLNTIADNRSSNWIENLDKNFEKMFEDQQFTKEILSLISKIPYVKKDFWELQMNHTSSIIKDLIKQHGDIIKMIYEKYMMQFHKSRKRNYIISKEFQTEVNNVINKMKTIRSKNLYIS